MIWRALAAVAVVIGVALAGTAGALGAAWLLTKIARRWGTDDIVIPPPVVKPEYRKADETLPANAARRREHAEAKRHEAAQIESGQPADDRIIRLVGRR
jgi:hypothetical protein